MPKSSTVKQIFAELDTQSFVSMRKNCKFFKQGVCAYKHTSLAEHTDKFKALENEIKILKNYETYNNEWKEKAFASNSKFQIKKIQVAS